MTINRHPHILGQLAPLLPPGGRRPDTRLAQDLAIGITGRQQLAAAIEGAWGTTLDNRAIENWITLADVCATIADSLPVAA